MPRYAYTAYAADGSTRSGELTAPDTDAANNTLVRRGLTVIELRPKRFSIHMTVRLRRTLRVRDLAQLARQLANTQTAGVPTYRAVGALAVQFGAGPVGDLLAGAEADMANGTSLSGAFRARERELGHLSCAMVEAGEATGQLGESLNRLADILENQARLRRKVLTAMTYPIFALVLSVVVFLGMVFFVVPIFAGIYDDLDADLPLLTTTLVAITKLMVGYTYVAAVLVAAAIFGYWRMMKIRWVRRERDRLLLRIPMFGKLIRSSIMSRVMSIVSSTMGAGVPLLEGIAVSAEAAGNIVFEDALVRVRESVRDGRSLHYALGEESVFPPLLSRVVETGEEAGTLTAMLDSYTSVVSEETETAAENFTTLIEPLMLLFVGAVVSVLLLALYLPLFNLATSI